MVKMPATIAYALALPPHCVLTQIDNSSRHLKDDLMDDLMDDLTNDLVVGVNSDSKKIPHFISMATLFEHQLLILK